MTKIIVFRTMWNTLYEYYLFWKIKQDNLSYKLVIYYNSANYNYAYAVIIKPYHD